MKFHTPQDYVKQTKEKNMSLVNDLGESKVTVKKDELLSKLLENLEKHQKDYAEAWAGYKAEILIRLNLAIDAVKNLDVVDLHKLGELPRPQNHAREYERVIRMLQMSVADQIQITETQFQMYVMDDWGWKQQFAVTKARYSSGR